MKSWHPSADGNKSAGPSPKMCIPEISGDPAGAGCQAPAHGAETPAARSGQSSGSRLLLSSLERLYDAPDQTAANLPSPRAALTAPIGDPEYDLSASLLEA